MPPERLGAGMPRIAAFLEAEAVRGPSPRDAQGLLRVQGFRVQGFRVWGFGVSGFGSGFEGLGVWGFRVEGLGVWRV